MLAVAEDLGCFMVDPDTGEVMISCRQQFDMGMEYQVALSGQCERAAISDATPSQVLSVYVGQRDPQFFYDPYIVNMSESIGVGDT